MQRRNLYVVIDLCSSECVYGSAWSEYRVRRGDAPPVDAGCSSPVEAGAPEMAAPAQTPESCPAPV